MYVCVCVWRTTCTWYMMVEACITKLESHHRVIVIYRCNSFIKYNPDAHYVILASHHTERHYTTIIVRPLHYYMTVIITIR